MLVSFNGVVEAFLGLFLTGSRFSAKNYLISNIIKIKDEPFGHSRDEDTRSRSFLFFAGDTYILLGGLFSKGPTFFGDPNNVLFVEHTCSGKNSYKLP